MAINSFVLPLSCKVFAWPAAVQSARPQDSQQALARAYGVALSTGLTVEEAATWPDRVLAVTPEQVNAAARKYLKKERSVTGVLKRPEEDA